MSRILPISVESLLEGGSVESERIEYEATWDPRANGKRVLRTICAFANDYHNLNGGYIVIGVEDDDGFARFPPIGIEPSAAARAQRWIRENCKRLEPAYEPVMALEQLECCKILIIWIPASDVRPHSAPDNRNVNRKYWIRIGASTVDAEKSGMLNNLMDQAAKISWDDRRSPDATIDDLQRHKIREYLQKIRSELLSIDDLAVLCGKVRLTRRVNNRDVPRNVGPRYVLDASSRKRPLHVVVRGG